MFGILLVVTGTLGAQEFSRFTYGGGAGFTTPVGNSGNNLDTGWNVRVGGGVNVSPYLGAMLNFGFDSMGVNSHVADYMGYGGARAKVFSLTLDPVVHLTPKGPVDIYVTGGGGYFRQYLKLNNPIDVNPTAYSRFFGFAPGTPAGTELTTSYSVNKPGIDAGVGIAFGHAWGGKFFAEARYDRIFTGAYHTDYLPVTFGFRK
jgi:hypothetical protein